MPEPVNPSDHSIRGKLFEDWAAEETQDNNARDAHAAWNLEALCEAIHQTFERDAHNVAEIAKYNEWLDSDEAPHNRPPLTAQHDPDTEIDRLARLIVDGEYRRRAQQQEATT